MRDWVVWNLSHWEKRESERREAWKAVQDLGEVALLQETVPPKDIENCVYREVGGRRRWGSSIVGFGVPVTEVTEAKGRYNSQPVRIVSEDLVGTMAIAQVGSGSSAITAISMYGLIRDGYADTTVNRQLSDLVPLLDNHRLGRRVLLGGDLNITTQWVGKDARYAAWEGATLQRFAAFGLTDLLLAHRPSQEPLPGCGCSFGDACRHIRTQYHGRSKRPWQNDYVFASEALTPKITDVRVVDSPVLRKLSSHLPIVLKIAL
jgi:hypothetical protein